MTIRPAIATPEAPTTIENADITVVGGAGHVGIPLVLALAEAGLRVNVNDSTSDASTRCAPAGCRSSKTAREAVLAKALAGKRLVFTNAPDRISTGGPVIITIGTPIDEFLNPVRRVVQDCIDGMLPRLADGQLAGAALDRVSRHHRLARLLSRSRRDASCKVAFCPERVVQGYGLKELRAMPQIVSGCTPEAERGAAELFERIAPEVVVVSPMEAEFAKLFSNAYRYIEFAATNEFYLVAKSAGVDYQRVLTAMKHNYPRLEEHAAAGLCRRPVPGEGHDAALGLRPQPVRPRPCRAADQRGPGAARGRRPQAPLRPRQHHGRPARHGVQGRERRHPRLAQLQVQEGAAAGRRARC